MQDKVNWKWDNRFEMALTEFDSDIQNNVKTILESFLNKSWDNSNIDSAPADVQQLIRRFGGLKSGQLLFLEDSSRDDFLFCLWWPWGNGSRVSIRVAPAIDKFSESELIGRYKTWFKI